MIESSSSRIIIINNKNAAAQSQHKSNNNLIEKIISETSSLSSSSDGPNDIYLFMDKLTDVGVRTRCDASDATLLRSDIQTKVKNLKSIVSTCPTYCRMGVNRNGLAYGARDFNLETLWERVDIDDASLLKNNALLGAYFIKFSYSKRYLCITKYGKYFTSISKSNECLWFNDKSKITSAVHRNINLVIDKNCNLENLVVDSQASAAAEYNQNHRRYTLYSSNDNTNNDRDECESNVKITLGPSPNLRKFFQTCQSSLLTNNNNAHHHQHPTSSSSRPSTTTKKPTKQTSGPPSVTIEKTEILCANYLLNEIEYAEMRNTYGGGGGGGDGDQQQAKSSNLIPEICIDYLLRLQNKQPPIGESVFNKQQESLAASKLSKSNNKAAIKHNGYNYVDEVFQEHDSDVYDENYHSQKTGADQIESGDGNKINTKFRKCYMLRNTNLYKKCMETHYKCYKYNNDPENLKKCRKKYGVTPAPRKKTNHLV